MISVCHRRSYRDSSFGISMLAVVGLARLCMPVAAPGDRTRVAPRLLGAQGPQRPVAAAHGVLRRAALGGAGSPEIRTPDGAPRHGFRRDRGGRNAGERDRSARDARRKRLQDFGTSICAYNPSELGCSRLGRVGVTRQDQAETRSRVGGLE